MKALDEIFTVGGSHEGIEAHLREWRYRLTSVVEVNENNVCLGDDTDPAINKREFNIDALYPNIVGTGVYFMV